MNYNNIPNEMKALSQWVCHKSYFDKASGKQKKIIISPVTGKFAKSNEPDTWTDYDTAKNYAVKNRYTGLTFALSEGIIFVDIDHAVDKATGEVISPDAVKLMAKLPDTYTETSVSGTGIHIFFKGTLPHDALKRNDVKGLEMYQNARFACLTGNTMNGITSLADHSDMTLELNHEFIGKRKPQELRTALSDRSDAELLFAIEKSRQGEKFSRLYRGDFSGYPSQSNADFALVSIIAWWTQDVGQIDRIFRSSGLYREKWDRSLGNSTYGMITINNALPAASGGCKHISYGLEM